MEQLSCASNQHYRLISGPEKEAKGNLKIAEKPISELVHHDHLESPPGRSSVSKEKTLKCLIGRYAVLQNQSVYEEEVRRH